MPDPQLKYDREEMTITLDGLGGGWTLGQLGELRLLDSGGPHSQVGVVCQGFGDQRS